LSQYVIRRDRILGPFMKEDITITEVNGAMGKCFGKGVELWHDGEQGIDLGVTNALSSKVGIWFGRLTDLLT
jgi:hypothetical protein